MSASSDVNAQVSATVRSLLAYRQTSPEVVMHALGMSKARDWTAGEVGALATFFGIPVQLLYAGPAEFAQATTDGRVKMDGSFFSLDGVSPRMAERELAWAS